MRGGHRWVRERVSEREGERDLSLDGEVLLKSPECRTLL